MCLAGEGAGAYLVLANGTGVDTSYCWSRYAVDDTSYLSAAIGGLIVSTTIGLAAQISAVAVRSSNSRTIPAVCHWTLHLPDPGELVKRRWISHQEQQEAPGRGREPVGQSQAVHTGFGPGHPA